MCPNPHKLSFATKQEAKDFIKNNKRKWDDKAMVYRCPGLGCDRWHITTHRPTIGQRASIKRKFG